MQTITERPTPEEENQIREKMQSGTLEVKIKIAQHFLGLLHGYYSQCHQHYIAKPEAKEAYEKTYAEAKFYLEFIKEVCVAWINTQDAPEDIKTKYLSYSQYAQLCLYQQCLPPHPSVACASAR